MGTTPASQAGAADSTGGFALVSSVTPISRTATVAAAESTPALAADALSSAQSSLDAAAAVTADIQASGLDIGEPDTSVDTAALQAAITRLSSADDTVSAFLPDIADDVTAALAPVNERVSHLRAGLDAAVQRKAEEEAAEKARQEAEAAAARAAAEAAAARAAAPTNASASAPAPRAVGGSAGEAQAIARDMLAARGWGDDQFACLVSLWNKESGWNYAASNRSSGAYGIPQALPGNKMASAGADWQTNPATQISWGLGYISGRYGTPCGAWGHSQSTGWY